MALSTVYLIKQSRFVLGIQTGRDTTLKLATNAAFLGFAL